jgi:membrane fusion protein (multidrug efflux system)
MWGERLRTYGPETLAGRFFKRFWKSLPALFVIALLLVILGLFAGIKAESERIEAEKLASLHRERPPVNVVVLTAAPRPIRDRLELPAVVEPWVELDLLAEVRGRVMEVAVEEGDYVRKGDLIALLDRRDYENELASARASHDLAMKTLTRMRNLHAKELIPKAELDGAEAEEDTLRAAVRNAELRLERCSIRAPMDGVVNRLDAKEGLLLSVADPVAVLLDIRRVKVTVGIPESDIDAVRRLKRFDVAIDALGGKVFRGRKLFLSKAPDTRAQLYRLEIELKNRSEEVLPGMFARADIVKREVMEGISVPLYTVVSRGDERFVYVEKDGKARTRLVELGILEGWLVQVTKGLESGDRVIIVGQRGLEEGQSVDVVRTVADPEELFR